MKLYEFINNFIEHNSLIRLLYKEKNYHKIILNDWNDVTMDHEILKGKGKFKNYINNEVIGIVSILVDGLYSEAINIVIEEIPIKKLRKNKIKYII